MTEARLGADVAERLSSRRPARGPPGCFPIVGIGASAGGLEACKKFVETLPARSGMAFILVQHLDPTHVSMMVDLLAPLTKTKVLEASQGLLLEPDHFYVIPRGAYPSVVNGALCLTQPKDRRGARLPFDFLLHSLSREYGARTICVVLSGTGADGSLGIGALKAKGGYVIAQDANEADYGGMPRSAIETGGVDLVLPAGRIFEALALYAPQISLSKEEGVSGSRKPARNWVPEIVDLLRRRTAHDFTLYKPGTLQRRIVQRMAMAAMDAESMGLYLGRLRNDANELDLLAKDLLINVTNFFRDPEIFDFLAKNIIPDLVRNHTLGRPLRLWVSACSTGEEAYSLAMLFCEEIATAGGDIRLQVFASDADPDAIATAREGLYPRAIETDVSADRLARFFLKEDDGYRISPVLRAAVIFTVHDMLTDPPFSRIDLVSCRNLLIYLGTEAQARAVSVFHFALLEGGILLLGGSETVGNVADRFELISKSACLYRRIGSSRPAQLGLSRNTVSNPRIGARPLRGSAPSRQATFAELCRNLVMETYAPAAILINRKCECLYFLGPADRYLQVTPGRPMHDLLAMVHEDVRLELGSAIQRAREENKCVVIAGGQLGGDGIARSFRIAVQPVRSDGEDLLFICFIDVPEHETGRGVVVGDYVPRVAELQQELEATKTELLGAIHNLEISSEEQKTINEEALSVNEEFQSTNEELLTSKEELQSLNEELIALNSQLQETLERQRTTSNDLQNVLYSTDVATIFLDADLNIRFFTPATKSLFNVIPGDIGRPLADLSSLASDGILLADARMVLDNLMPIEREIEAQSGAWYIRRISPYRTQDKGVEGVVITFADITERRRAADGLETAKRQAQLANVAKSRFLASASHDLRQPLQTLALLQEQLTKTVQGDAATKLVARLAQTLGTMSNMLNTLLDINQIEAGTIRAEAIFFPINEMFERLRDEFGYHAQAQGLVLHVVPCGLIVHSDPQLLEQIVRNLLSNALKYTKRGKVLLGCRRHGETLSIEIWDTGIGIPEADFQAIFEEYHQLDHGIAERSRGLGLGLSIVQQLGNMLGHGVRVRSSPGKGSVFAVDIRLSENPAGSEPQTGRRKPIGETVGPILRRGAIFVIEDDPQLRELLELLLQGEGHYVVGAPDGPAALELVVRGAVRPDLILADYNLPNGMDGLELGAKLREKLGRHIPVIILTGDISTEVLRNVARHDCVQLNKPVKLAELSSAIQRLLPASQTPRPGVVPQSIEGRAGAAQCVIFIVDDDNEILEAMRVVLEEAGRTVETFSSCEAFLEAYRPVHEACLLIDAYLPGMSGLELLRRLKEDGSHLPAIMITGNSDVSMAVQAMKAGASDFIEKPVGSIELLASIERALEQSMDAARLFAWRETAANYIAALTLRQREVMDLVLAGHPNKNIAADLGISQRTVENHRASIMKKTGSKSLPALARLALAAAWSGSDEAAVPGGFPATAAWPLVRR